jgi:hypothetical protein
MPESTRGIALASVAGEGRARRCGPAFAAPARTVTDADEASLAAGTALLHAQQFGHGPRATLQCSSW